MNGRVVIFKMVFIADYTLFYIIITVTSWWARWHLKSPASRSLRLFAQPFIQVQTKKTSKLRLTSLCEWNSSLNGEFPAQRAGKRKMFPLMGSSCGAGYFDTRPGLHVSFLLLIQSVINQSQGGTNAFTYHPIHSNDLRFLHLLTYDIFSQIYSWSWCHKGTRKMSIHSCIYICIYTQNAHATI